MFSSSPNKWMALIETSSKIKMTCTSGAYSLSHTPLNYEYNSTSPMERPTKQKAAKIKGKSL
jgi:hypothetical protein